MDSRPSRSVAWEPAPSENFAGRVWFGAMAEAQHEGGLTVLGVLFEPSARTNWHSHPEGQILYGVLGNGLVQAEDGSVERIGPGDIVRTPSGEVHWHGSQSDSFLVHLSLTTGGVTEWLDRPVTSAQYDHARR